MKTAYKTILFALCLGTISLAAKAQDTLSILPDTLSSSFTMTLTGAELSYETDSFTVVIRRFQGGRDRKTYITFFADRVVSNGTTIVRNLQDGYGKHDYTFVRRGTTLSIYRDNVLFAEAASENTTDNFLYYTDNRTASYEYTLLKQTAKATDAKIEVVSATEYLVPDATAVENNIGAMLGGTNLFKDPYMTGGFRTEATATERSFITNSAILSGWGNAAVMTADSYSGPYAVQLSGQAFNNGAASTGASLNIPATMTANTTYIVRAMVKSDGYEGRIGINGEDSYIHITDTNNEWKQVEGLFTPKAARTALFVDNADYENDGTLTIDNVEVYKSVSFTGYNSSIPYAVLPANRVSKNSFAGTSAYMLGFTLNGDASSQLDTTGLNYAGAAALTIKAKGSVLYPIYLPATLRAAYLKGTYDGWTENNVNAVRGLDFVLYRYAAPYFETVSLNEDVPAGCYMLQFVDNLENVDVTLMTGASSARQNSSNNSYSFRGNDSYRLFTPEGQYLRYNQSEGRFVLTTDEALAPFEAYFATTEEVPVNYIYPSLTATGLQSVQTDNGARISVISGKGHIIIYADSAAELPVYRIDGTQIATLRIYEGENTASMPAGFYIVGNKKVIVM